MRNKKLQLVIAVMSVMLLTLVSIIWLLCVQNRIYRDETNERIETILNAISKNNPDIDVKQIADILNDKNMTDSSDIKSKLADYGIDFDRDFAVKELDAVLYKTIAILAIIVAVAMGLIISAFVMYYRSVSRKVDEIVDYIDKIHNKDYSLKLKDNSEDELSRLKNELYKIVVMLKEQSDNSNIEKEKLSVLVADISHQIKTPLTSISIMLDNISDNPDMELKVRDKFIANITRQIEWVNWLVVSLLKLAKFDAGVVQFEVEQINVNKIFDNVCENLRAPCSVCGVDIVVNGSLGAAFEGDYKWQLEAFTNIVKNCIEHTHTGGHICIDYQTNNLYTKITISDNGSGICKEDLRHVFERFYRGKNASENSIGIGLALAKTIIERDGGYITCESKEGEGTTFTIKYN